MPEADASVIIKRVACQLFIIKKEKGKESMKIAVTYDNGEVFQHFGRTENFKVYEIEDNKGEYPKVCVNLQTDVR